jgi:hypothetical protein
MAEEKKPKIDLKARLGKTAMGGATPAPPAGIPVPAPSPGAQPNHNALHVGTPSSSPRPMAPGIPVGPPPAFGKASSPPLDPSNPLAAAVAPPYRAPAPAPAAPPQPQRIEVDEMAVQVARKGARKQGLVAGLVAALVLGAVGFIAGGAKEQSKARQISVEHAQQLVGDVQKAHDQLKTIADKVEAGKNTLVKDHKFPATLAHDLGGLNVDFDGGKLAGVRFSGFSQETTSGLIEFITAVQSINDRKLALINLLNHLQKPITEQLTGTQKATIGYVILVGGPKDPSGNPYSVLAPLTKPIDVTDPAHVQLPSEFAATNPINRVNVKAPAYKGGALDKPAAMYVAPKSVSAACPSEEAGLIGQLGSQLSHLTEEINGEQPPAGTADIVTNTKTGLLERSETLIKNLKRVK